MEGIHKLERYNQKVRELLTSEIGIQKRKQRSADIEPVFAQMKHNYNFRRFSLKVIQKTELEFWLTALAHNVGKKIAD
ncbi:transposase [Sphingobacterium faecium]|uniref:transposase n=1 Tax=Sphingobacterium faecium TaxID=34087 RepID=UPI003742070B